MADLPGTGGVSGASVIPLLVCLGVDPGVSGGLAGMIVAGGHVDMVEAVRMPSTDADVWGWFEEIRSASSEARSRVCLVAVIEKVGGYVRSSKDGETGGPQPGSSAFRFGRSYGALHMALTAAEIPLIAEPTPGVWQRGVGVTPRRTGESRVSHKNRLKARAQQLFPSVKVTLAVADALLLAWYCRSVATSCPITTAVDVDGEARALSRRRL